MGICTESWRWEENPLLYLGIKPASEAYQSDTLPAELHLPKGFNEGD